MRKTGWYPGTVRPVRVGWYECWYADDDGYKDKTEMRYWDGLIWRAANAFFSFECRFASDAYAKKDRWRGLTRGRE
jgi:hypothetical protein